MKRLHFRECPDGTVRVWWPEWDSDVFEIFSRIEFSKLKWFCAKLCIRLEEQFE